MTIVIRVVTLETMRKRTGTLLVRSISYISGLPNLPTKYSKEFAEYPFLQKSPTLFSSATLK
jgi:hypothetical protein